MHPQMQFDPKEGCNATADLTLLVQHAWHTKKIIYGIYSTLFLLSLIYHPTHVATGRHS